MRIFTTILVVFYTATSFASTKVGVVSILGNNVTLTSIGTTVFGNKASEVPTVDWLVDDKIVNFLIDSLEKKDNLQFLALKNHGLSYRTITQDYKFISGKVLTKSSITRLCEIGKQRSIDQILLIAPSTVYVFMLGRDVGMKGYGVYYDSGYIFTYITGHAYLVDVVTGEMLGDKDLRSVSKLRTKRPFTDTQKEVLYNFVTEGINSEDLLNSWRKKIYVNNSSEKYKDLLYSLYEDENSGLDDLDESLTDLMIYLNPPHHKHVEFSSLPKEEVLKIKSEILSNINSKYISRIKGIFPNTK